MALPPGPPGSASTRRELLDFMVQRGLTEADTVTIRLGAIPSGLTSDHLHHPPHIFYGPDALPAAQPTVSNHLITAHLYKKNTFEKICSGQMILKVTQDLWKWHCLTGHISLPISGLLVSRNSTIYSRNDLQGLKVINDGAIL